MKLKILVVSNLILTWTLFAAVSFGNQEELLPSAFFPETTYEFSPVLDGTEVVHDFVIQNKGNATLKVNQVKTG